MITADTITGRQIADLRFATPISDTEIEHLTLFAVLGTGSYRARARARARCAELINARQDGAK